MSKPIRVLHSIPGYSVGGIESLVMSLYRNIDKSLIQFDLLVETQEWLADFEEIVQGGGRVYQLSPFNKKNPFIFIKEVRNFFKQHKKEYKVLHSHTITRSAPLLYYAKHFGISCRISHAHTDKLDGNKFIKLSEFLMRINNKLSTHYLAASKQAGYYYFHKDKKKFTVLKNTIDTEKFSYSQKTRQVVRKSLNLESHFVIGHTGRFTYQKNHWKIIKTFYEVHKILPEARLLLVGDGPTMSEIKDMANKLGIIDYIIFTGTRNDVSNLLQAMDLFFLPSFFEGFCISLLEAQSIGLPCIASDIIPKEVQLTELITTLSLDEDNKIWAKAIISYQEHQRTSQNKIIIKRGYDTKSNAKWLRDFYLSCST